MDLQFLRVIILLVVLVINILLLFLVYSANRKNATNFIFAILALVMSVWLVAIFLSGTPSTNLWWSRITIFFATLMSFLFFLLAHTLPSERLLLSKGKLIFFLIATMAVMLVTLSPFAFVTIDYSIIPAKLVTGPGMAPFALVTTFFAVAAFYNLLKKLRHSTGIEKQQFRFVLLGIFLMLGLIIATIMIPVLLGKGDRFISFAPLYASIFLVMTAVAILKYHLFNIKLIATEALVTILMLVLLFEGLLSGSFVTIIFKTSFAIVVGIVGILLLRSVKKEIAQREELTHLAVSLEKANEQLKELDHQKTDFLSIAAHQLRTPLSIINGYVELIKEGAYGKVHKKTKDILDNIDSSNGHLIKLVDEFLDITRIEQGRTKFDIKPRDMVELITNTVKELSVRAEQSGYKLVWKPEEKNFMVPMDDEKVRHVVFNFIDNAIKYGEDKGKITLSATREDAGLAVRVHDQGLGFGAVDEASFFQKFYRGNNVKGINVNGTGLGLYVCRKFIEAHHGRIWAHSAGMGKGSEFGFWIPN